MPRSHLWFGKTSTGKTKAALDGATPESPVSYHELEFNGFKRGSNRLHLAEGAVTVHHYKVPSPEMEQMGEVQVANSGKVLPQVVYRLEGWEELIGQFNKNYTADVKQGRRPVVDTATRLWLAQRQAFEQAVQNAASRQEADRLGQLRFTTPNSRMIGASSYGLEHHNLDTILIAHEDVQFGTQAIKVDTMKEIENLVDVVLRFEWKDGGPVATFWKGSEAGSLRGIEVVEPTLTKVNEILDAAAVLEHMGVTLPRASDEIVRLSRDERFLACANAILKEGQQMPVDEQGIIVRGGLLLGEG